MMEGQANDTFTIEELKRNTESKHQIFEGESDHFRKEYEK
jgi:hypothetical protein